MTATDAALDPVLPAFLGLLADPQPPVRHAAVLLVSATVHHKLPLVRGRLPGLLPLLHEQTVIRQELIRLVDLGPFKVQQDDGLELRKAAFECVDSLLEVVPKALDPAALAATLKTGLGDQYDVKITAHSILSRTCAAAPAVVVQELDAVVEQLEKTLTEKLKQDAVKQDVDRQKEMVRSALRAVHSIEGIADSAKNQHFATFIAKVIGPAARTPAFRSFVCAARSRRSRPLPVVATTGRGHLAGQSPDLVPGARALAGCEDRPDGAGVPRSEGGAHGRQRCRLKLAEA